METLRVYENGDPKGILSEKYVALINHGNK